MSTRTIQRAAWAVAVILLSVWLVQSFVRWQTFHNPTFDLAFYARMAWGMAHANFWVPIIDGLIWGLHISPVLLPLGIVGTVFGTAPTLLLAQVVAAGAAMIPLSRFATRKLGPNGGWFAVLAWVLYPNLSHVLTQEFHPGTLALWPWCAALDALDRRSARSLIRSCLGMLACREDLAIAVVILGLLGHVQLEERYYRRQIKWLVGGTVAYFALFAFVLHPLCAPRQGSLVLHFGKWGSSASGVVIYLLTHPQELWSYLIEGGRLLYLPKIASPLLLLPFLSPRLLLSALPIVGMNLLSQFPGTLDFESHYLTLALPALMFAAINSVSKLSHPVTLSSMVVLATLGFQAVVGGTPGALKFKSKDFRADEKTYASRAIVSRIPDEVSVQAPDPLLAHIAERDEVFRAPPPDRGAKKVVLDLSHRRRFLHQENLIRSSEEPEIRNWLARADYGAIAHFGDWLMLEEGVAARDGIARPYFVTQPTHTSFSLKLTHCLALQDARFTKAGLELDFVVLAECPADLALRLGITYRPARVDLLFDGLLSPVQLKPGERVRSTHQVDATLYWNIHYSGLRLGMLRTSGAKPEHADPTSLPVPVREVERPRFEATQ